MDYPYVVLLLGLQEAGVPEEYYGAAELFRAKYNDYQMSSSTCLHMGEGWFILYDFPLAERWIKESSWNAKITLCADTSYAIVNFEDLAGAVEMKLRWHNT